MNPIIKTRELSERWKIPYHSARTLTPESEPEPLTEDEKLWLEACEEHIAQALRILYKKTGLIPIDIEIHSIETTNHDSPKKEININSVKLTVEDKQ